MKSMFSMGHFWALLDNECSVVVLENVSQRWLFKMIFSFFFSKKIYSYKQSAVAVHVFEF